MDEGGSGQLLALCPLSSLPDGTMARSCSAPGPAAAEPRVLQTRGGDTEPSGQGSAGHYVTALSRWEVHASLAPAAPESEHQRTTVPSFHPQGCHRTPPLPQSCGT